MQIINKIFSFFKQKKFNYIEYNNKLEKELNNYFNNHLDYSEYYFNKFKSYILYKCKIEHKYPTDSEIERFLKREIIFNQIRNRLEEAFDLKNYNILKQI